jgi:hypothetical protein
MHCSCLSFAAACTSGCMHGVCAGDVDFWYDHVLLNAYLPDTDSHFKSFLQHLLRWFVRLSDQSIALYVIPFVCRQDGLAQHATPPYARMDVILMAATAMCLESACARLATLGLSALPVCPLLLFSATCQLTHVFVEGLFLNMPVTSSLVTATSYQNASVYLDLSSNTGFKSFKVRFIISVVHTDS